MFSGIGGFRSGLEAVGGFECIGYCEIDQYARRAYEAMYNTKGEMYFEDAAFLWRKGHKCFNIHICIVIIFAFNMPFKFTDIISVMGYNSCNRIILFCYFIISNPIHFCYASFSKCVTHISQWRSHAAKVLPQAGSYDTIIFTKVSNPL